MMRVNLGGNHLPVTPNRFHRFLITARGISILVLIAAVVGMAAGAIERVI